MDTSSLRSLRRRGSRSGFSLLEVMFAVVVMNVLVTVTARQLIAHNELVGELEEWCENDPIYYVDPQADPLHRASEVPADLRGKTPFARWKDKVKFGYDVEITAVERDLESLTSKALVVQSAVYKVDPDAGGGG